LELAEGKSPKEYFDAIGNGLGDAGQGLLGFQVSHNQPSLFGYFFGDGKSIGTKLPTLPVPLSRNTPPYSGSGAFLHVKECHVTQIYVRK
jgi:hypothetical protein